MRMEIYNQIISDISRVQNQGGSNLFLIIKENTIKVE